MLDWLLDPLSFRFMRMALLEAMIVGTIAGMLGTFVVVRGLAFISEAISHTVFPGVVIAFLLNVNVFVGGAAFGLLTAVLITGLAQTRRLREDTVIGVVFAGAFALGVVLISTSPAYAQDLTAILFGDVLAVTETDIFLTLGVGVVALAVTLRLRRVLLLAFFDREMAQALGLPVFLLETLLLMVITLAIVVSLRAVGNILVLALFVTPAATARLLVDDLERMMPLSAALGAMSGIAGLYISWHTDLAAGGTIVLTATGLFLMVALFAPRHGFVAGLRKGRGKALEVSEA